MGWLCGLLAALAVVTLVGHGIWVLIATLLRGGTERPPGRPDPFDELVRTEFQINRLAHAGFLDEATRQRVIGAIVAARERSVAPRPVPVLPLAPVAKDAVQEAAVPPPPPAVSLLTPSDKRVLERPPVAVQSRQPVLRHIPPRKPSRPFSEVVASFMRESNIRWAS